MEKIFREFAEQRFIRNNKERTARSLGTWKGKTGARKFGTNQKEKGKKKKREFLDILIEWPKKRKASHWIRKTKRCTNGNARSPVRVSFATKDGDALKK